MVTDYYLPTLGGIQTSIKAQKDALEALGHQVTVCAPAFDRLPDPADLALPFIGLSRKLGYPLAGMSRPVLDTLRSHFDRVGNPDLIHCHSDLLAGIMGVRLAQERHLPLVQSMHGREDVFVPSVMPASGLVTLIWERWHHHYIPHDQVTITPDRDNARTGTARRMWRVMVAHANAADQVIVPSDHMRRRLVKYGLIKPASVVSNGIPGATLDQIGQPTPRQPATGEPLRVVWCGRVSAEKRPLEFLAGVAQATGRLEVDMFGDGFVMAKARQFVTDHGLADRVRLHGGVPQAEVLAAMKQAHVFVQTSFDCDTQAMTLLEAVSTGLPVIYCDPDLGEPLPAEGRLLTSTPDPADIAAALDQLAHDPGRVAQMSQAMVEQRAIAYQDSHTATLLSVYEQALASPR
jgi:glycosyltransferase involved in cell wall biosynthesis